VQWILFTEQPDGEAAEYIHALTVQLCESFYST
jgi:hypothetical protein